MSVLTLSALLMCFFQFVLRSVVFLLVKERAASKGAKPM